MAMTKEEKIRYSDILESAKQRLARMAYVIEELRPKAAAYDVIQILAHQMRGQDNGFAEIDVGRQLQVLIDELNGPKSSAADLT